MHAPGTRLNEVFFALSDPTRRAMVGRLVGGPATVGELGAPFPISAPAVTKHLKVLERAGLVSRRVEGRRHHCTLEPVGLREVGAWLDVYREFWERSLDRLDELLRNDEQPDPRKPAVRRRKGNHDDTDS